MYPSATDMMPAGFAAFWVLYLIYFVFVYGLSILMYVLRAIGVYSIAKRRGIKRPWMAWVPVVEGATLRMRSFLMEKVELEAHEAGMLLSLAGDLRICQAVDPNKTCRMELALSLLKDCGYTFP